MSRFAVLCGPPGSGKTAFRHLLEKRGWTAVCPDDIREELYGDASIQGNPSEVFDTAFQRVREKLAEGDVVFDATNCRSVYRKDLLAATDGYFEAAACIWFDTPLAVCLKRNSERDRKVPEKIIRRMWDELHEDKPDISEGFDKIIRIDLGLSTLMEKVVA